MTLFEVSIRYSQSMENGLTKKVTETYLVDAQTFTEAEIRTTTETSYLTTGEMEVSAIKRSNITMVLPPALASDGQTLKWFRAKLNFIALDEKTAKEKKQAVYYAVYATDIDKAHRLIDKYMGDSVINYEFAAINDTKIVEFIKQHA
jgi:hypothetical protein